MRSVLDLASVGRGDNPRFQVKLLTKPKFASIFSSNIVKSLTQNIPSISETEKKDENEKRMMVFYGEFLW